MVFFGERELNFEILGDVRGSIRLYDDLSSSSLFENWYDLLEDIALGLLSWKTGERSDF